MAYTQRADAAAIRLMQQQQAVQQQAVQQLQQQPTPPVAGSYHDHSPPLDHAVPPLQLYHPMADATMSGMLPANDLTPPGGYPETSPGFPYDYAPPPMLPHPMEAPATNGMTPQIDVETMIGTIEQSARYSRHMLKKGDNRLALKSISELIEKAKEIQLILRGRHYSPPTASPPTQTEVSIAAVSVGVGPPAMNVGLPPQPLVVDQDEADLDPSGPKAQTRKRNAALRSAAGDRVAKATKFNDYAISAARVDGVEPPDPDAPPSLSFVDSMQAAVDMHDPMQTAYGGYTTQMPYPDSFPLTLPTHLAPASSSALHNALNATTVSPAQVLPPPPPRDSPPSAGSTPYSPARSRAASGTGADAHALGPAKRLRAELAVIDEPPRASSSRSPDEIAASMPPPRVRPMGPLPPLHGAGSEMSAELRATIDGIFFSYLNSVCSNLDATDPKGEPIHQTLMAKKMQRLDESPDYRPFKFRIQAFTNGFLDELARHGFPEDKLPMKKVRNYLWQQPYIARFNEDGRRAKSKGNHIWNIEAMKHPDTEGVCGGGAWTFRQFGRRIAGNPPPVAYVGARWAWTPRVWDPQAPKADVEVVWGSPPGRILNWLSWDKDTLAGVPDEESDSGEVTVAAKFVQDGREVTLERRFLLTVAPVTSEGAAASTRSRRPQLSSTTRRVVSDTLVNQPQAHTPPSRALPVVPAAVPPPPSEDAQVKAIVDSACAAATDRKAEVDYMQVQGLSHSNPARLAQFEMQQRVLAATKTAIEDEMHHGGAEPASRALAEVAQKMVYEAAQQVTAERANQAVMHGVDPGSVVPVTVMDVTAATQTAIAQAVLSSDIDSTEVEVMMTAKSIIHNHQIVLDPSNPAQRAQGPQLTGLVAPTSSIPTMLSPPSVHPVPVSMLPPATAPLLATTSAALLTTSAPALPSDLAIPYPSPPYPDLAVAHAAHLSLHESLDFGVDHVMHPL